MLRAIAQGINNVEELERVEREEAEEEARRNAVIKQLSLTAPNLPNDFEFNWDKTYPGVPLSPSALHELRLLAESIPSSPSEDPGGTGPERRSP
jgi:hypothetical protein